MNPKPTKQRLDCLLVARGLFESREKAQRAIMAGEVSVGLSRGDLGSVCPLHNLKPGTRVSDDAQVTVKASMRYVGRGGFKLEGALQHFKVDPTGMTCLDIGASTGGFTDCLLQHGAIKVHAVDVGHSQLDWKIRSDPRVVVREKCNARFLSRAEVPDPIALCVIDVSFISLNLILPAAFDLLTPEGVILALIKPQFELSRQEVGKGGIVREAELHQKAVEKIRHFVLDQLSKTWDGVMVSPILGTEGNKEFLACLRK